MRKSGIKGLILNDKLKTRVKRIVTETVRFVAENVNEIRGSESVTEKTESESERARARTAKMGRTRDTAAVLWM